ncbi:hypothetical protein BU26DRAFT_241648 [Trematosphaeria pertusa]|uniref:F-box domain-containing protein n=1 Tax=Trematosphaeria pertusa TaxID=390896 RepID=A0A6A6IMR7_9PLEO|nr:uncharacterized protein BU26DRAFT_241648 [Trematosphaeria pertusa]KAF2251686.1 hypothetical protein BU26DRAFT_241648 [Trematosphaeria pertusa]
MASITSLANELLVNVASSLDQQSLCSLNLVSKKFSPIARDILYSRPYIPPPYGRDGLRTEPDDRLLHLIRTLLDNPEYAEKVHRLTFSTGLCRVPEEGFGFAEMRRKGVEVVRKFASASVREDWIAKLDLGDHDAWGGVLLAIVPTLKVLEFQPLSVTPEDGPTYHIWQKLFRGDKMGGTIDLNLIPGLKGLQHLHFYGDYFQWEWLKLSSLQFLRLGVVCHMPVPEEMANHGISPGTISAITTLAITQRVPFDSHAVQPHLGHSLAHPIFSNMARLEVHISNLLHLPDPGRGPGTLVRLYDASRHCGDWDYLGPQLEYLSDRLESFWLGVKSGEDPGFLDSINPFGTLPSPTTLTVLTKLKTLVLPQDALFKDGEPIPDLCQLLPASLQTLGLLYPTKQLCDFLDCFLLSMGSFPHLRTLELHCRNDRGVDYPTMCSDDNPKWDELKEAGFAVEIYH